MSAAWPVQMLVILCALGLMALGVLLYISPDVGMRVSSHRLAALPLVVGGRYVFFGALLLAAVLYGDHKVTAFLLAGFACLGGLDAFSYADAMPLPHLLAGLASLAGCLYFLRRSKGKLI